MNRRRLFWLVLPIAVVFALWAGPGLSADDVSPVPDPEQPARGAIPTTVPHEPECRAPAEPGPDGDG